MQNKKTIRRKLSRYGYFPYVLAAIAFYVIFLLMPIISSFSYSLYEWDGFSENAVFVGLNNYRVLFSDPRFIQTLDNTFFLAIAGPLIQTSLALVLAVLIANVVKGKLFYRTALYLPLILPLVATSIIWFIILSPHNGILNSIIRLFGFPDFSLAWLGNTTTALPAVLAISVWRFTGFNIVIFVTGLQNISSEYYEAAKMDGASNIQLFFRITLPLLSSSTMINFALNLIGYLRLFDIIWVTTSGGPAFSTSVISTYIFTHAFQFSAVGIASAASVILFFIIAFVSGLYMWLVGRSRVRGGI